jgi:hypothetical protein
MPVPFTKANAAEMARKSHEQRRINQALRDDALSKPTLMSHDGAQPDQYVAVQLTRARTHISRINSMLDRETDAQTLERLSRALGVLSERERVLAGRPLPGSRRPAKESPTRPRSILALPQFDGEPG